MDIRNIGASSISDMTNQKGKLKDQAKAMKNPNDYWQAGGAKFNKLNDIGQAIKEGKLSIPKSEGKLHVAHKEMQIEKGKKLKSLAGKIGLGTLAGFGLTMGMAALFPIVSPALVLIPMMGTMLSGGIGMGFHKAGKAFGESPQISEQGHVSMQQQGGKTVLEYQDFDTNKKKSMIDM
ncbi:MAG: hypothetical protein K8T10_11520 [Candidatus Eremiobacteraeota bacterium]|nr:hypothetical protein [Candidatus Eremiobacteraeota bacterium]